MRSHLCRYSDIYCKLVHPRETGLRQTWRTEFCIEQLVRSIHAFMFIGFDRLGSIHINRGRLLDEWLITQEMEKITF